MKRATTIIGLLACFVLLTGADCGGDDTGFDGGSDNPHCASNTYVGNLNGVEATIKVTVEPLVTHTYVQGQLTSPTANYTFTADMMGDRGWGDMVDLLTNERFRIQLDLLPGGGLILTANPFGGATSYQFQCR